MTRDRLVALAVFLVALSLRLAFVAEYERDLGLDVRRLDQTDNHTFSMWARDIAAGDVLGRRTVHAFHAWTAEVAPESRWLRWYGDPRTFHQSPLYAYFVAVVYRLFGEEHATFARVQAVIGALTCLLTFLLVRRHAGLFAAGAAGFLLALCGPYFLYDVYLLRDGPLAFLTVLLALALDRLAARGRTRDAFVAGLALGLFTLAKETGPALFGLTLLAWLVARRSRPRRALDGAAVLAAAFVLAVSPALLRNALVGAPLAKLSTRGPEVFVTGNVVGEDGVEWSPPPRDLRAILVETGFSLPRTMAQTVATHRPRPQGWLELLWDKTAAFFNGWEIPNNVNYYLVVAHCWTLSAGFVNLAWLSPLALLGVLVSLPRWRRRAPLLLLFGALAASVVLLYVIARFRVHVLPLFCVFAGFFVEWLSVSWRARRHARLLAAGVAFVVLVRWCLPAESHEIGGIYRYAIPMHKHLVTMDLERAAKFRDAARRFAEERGLIPYDEQTVAQFREIDAAFEDLEEAARRPVDDADRYLHLGQGYCRLTRVTKKGLQRQLADLAKRQLDRALDLVPELRGVHRVLGEVESALGHDEEALHEYAVELDRHPDDVETLVLVGEHFFGEERVVDAAVYFERAIALGCREPEVLVHSAQALVDPRTEGWEVPLPDGGYRPAHDPETALRRAEWALREAPDDPDLLEPIARVFYARGVLAGRVELVDRAIDLLERLYRDHYPESRRLPNVIAGFRRIRERRFGPQK